MKKILLMACSVILSVGMVTTSYAADFNSGQSVKFDQKATDDVYLAGQEVSVFSEIPGDLYAAGGLVNFQGNVGQDAVLAGGKVTLRGAVGDDTRIAGGTVLLQGAMIHDLIVAGGDVTIDQATQVLGNVVVWGGLITINGTINGNVTGGGGKIIIDGKINGHVDLTVKEELTLTKNALISGNLSYRARKAVNLPVPNTQVQGQTIFNPLPFKQQQANSYRGMGFIFGGAWLLFKLMSYLSLLFLGLLIVLIMPSFLSKTAIYVNTSFWKNVLIGLVFMMLLLPVSLILLITGVGFFAVIILACSAVILWIFAKLFVAMWLGQFLFPNLVKPTKAQTFGVLAVGLFCFYIISFVPIIGWLIGFILTLAGLGALLVLKKEMTMYLMKKKQI